MPTGQPVLADAKCIGIKKISELLSVGSQSPYYLVDQKKCALIVVMVTVIYCGISFSIYL